MWGFLQKSEDHQNLHLLVSCDQNSVSWAPTLDRGFAPRQKYSAISEFKGLWFMNISARACPAEPQCSSALARGCFLLSGDNYLGSSVPSIKPFVSKRRWKGETLHSETVTESQHHDFKSPNLSNMLLTKVKTDIPEKVSSSMPFYPHLIEQGLFHQGYLGLKCLHKWVPRRRGHGWGYRSAQQRRFSTRQPSSPDDDIQPKVFASVGYY